MDEAAVAYQYVMLDHMTALTELQLCAWPDAGPMLNTLALLSALKVPHAHTSMQAELHEADI